MLIFLFRSCSMYIVIDKNTQSRKIIIGINIKTNIKEIYFLHSIAVTIHQPYKKTTIIRSSSKHHQTIMKLIPQSINRRITENSSNETRL